MYWQSLSEWRNYHLTSSVDQATSLSPRAAVQWRSFLLICSAFKGIHTTLRGLLKAMIFVCYRQTKGGFFPFKWTNVLVCFIFRLVILSEHWFFFVTEDLYVQVSTFNHLLYNYWPCLFFHIVGWLLGMIVIIFSLLNLSPPLRILSFKHLIYKCPKHGVTSGCSCFPFPSKYVPLVSGCLLCLTSTLSLLTSALFVLHLSVGKCCCSIAVFVLWSHLDVSTVTVAVSSGFRFPSRTIM